MAVRGGLGASSLPPARRRSPVAPASKNKTKKQNTLGIGAPWTITKRDSHEKHLGQESDLSRPPDAPRPLVIQPPLSAKGSIAFLFLCFGVEPPLALGGGFCSAQHVRGKRWAVDSAPAKAAATGVVPAAADSGLQASGVAGVLCDTLCFLPGGTRPHFCWAVAWRWGVGCAYVPL